MLQKTIIGINAEIVCPKSFFLLERTEKPTIFKTRQVFLPTYRPTYLPTNLPTMINVTCD